MKKTMNVLLGLTLAMTCLVSSVWAAPKVEVSIVAEKEILIEENGEKITKRISADVVAPGDTVFYTLSFKNSGDEVATGVVLVDPVPKNTAYISGSAFGPGSEISFSIDQGESYNKSSLLTYVANGQKRSASPNQYTHIRWVVKSVGVDKSGVAGFKVLVK